MSKEVEETVQMTDRNEMSTIRRICGFTLKERKNANLVGIIKGMKSFGLSQEDTQVSNRKRWEI